MLEIAFRPDRRRPEPVYRQLEEALRGLIRAGQLATGEKLPATRELAAALGLSRNTVSAAYEGLAEAGLTRSHVGQGTFVRRPSGAEPGAAPPALGASPPGIAWEGLFAGRGHALRLLEAARASRPAGRVRFDFRPGRVDRAALPRSAVRRALARAADAHLEEAANRLDPRGWPPLRAEVARSLVARGVACEAGDVMIVDGAQQALALLAQVLLDAGDAAVVEQPGYFGAPLAVLAAGGQCLAAPVDAGGLRTDALARLLRRRRAKLVVATPTVQFPTGAALAPERREALLALAAEHQTPVVEDDYDGELRLGAPVVPALKTQDTAGVVVYVGTFSKALFPALRLGYVVAPRPLLARLAAAKATADFGSAALPQAALAELLATGAVERHVRRARRRYAARRDALLAALEAEMPAGTRAARPAGGSAVWVTLPEDVDPDALQRTAGEAGLAYARGDAFSLDGSGAGSLLLSFAELPPETIHEGVAALARATRGAQRRAA